MSERSTERTEAAVFVLADRALDAVIQQIEDAQWELPIPSWFQLGHAPDRIPTLRTIVNYHAYDELWVPVILAGKRMDEVPDMPAMGDDILGDDPRAAFAALVDKGVAAAEALDDPDRITHLSYGDWKAGDYLMHITSFRGFRTVDIARLIGADTTLPDDLVQGMWDEFSPHFEQWRAMGIFKAALPIPQGASLQDRLLLSVGRQAS